MDYGAPTDCYKKTEGHAGSLSYFYWFELDAEYNSRNLRSSLDQYLEAYYLVPTQARL